MKCRRAKQLVFDFLDGVIADSDRVNLEQHLNECKSCEVFTSRIAASLDLLHRVPEEEPSDNFNWKVRLRLAREKNAISDAIVAQREIFKTWNLRFAISALSTFVLILAGGYFLWMSGYLPESRGPSMPISGELAQYERNVATEYNSTTGKIPSPFETSWPNLTTPVSGGSRYDTDHSDIQGAINTMILNPDSLVWMKLKSLPKLYRIRQLEGQVIQLQKYLRECEQRD